MAGRSCNRESRQKIFYTLITLRSNMTKSRQETHRAVWSKSAGQWMTSYGCFLLCAFVSVDIICNKIIIQHSGKCCVQFTKLHNINNWSRYYKMKWFPKTDILHHVRSDWASTTTRKWILHTDIMVVYDDLLTALHVLLHYIQHSHWTSELRVCIF